MNNFFAVILAFVGLFASFASEAQIKHVVLDLENVLIQQIPYQNYKSFKEKSQLIQARIDGNYLSYYVHLGGKELLNRLVERKDLTVHVASDKTLRQTQTILDVIDDKFRGKLEAAKGKILTAENKKRDQVDLELISDNINEVVFITHDPKKLLTNLFKKQTGRALDLGPAFYKYESWEDSQVGAKAAGEKKSDFFPKSYESWRFESYKLPILANVLKRSPVAITIEAFKDAIKRDVEKQIKFGSAILKGDKTAVSWTTSFGKLNGCESYDLIDEKILETLPVSKCMAFLPNTVEWQKELLKDTIKACVVKSEDGKSSASLPVADCITDKVKSYWTGKEQRTCSYYTDKLELISAAPEKNCDEQHLIEDPKTKQRIIFKAFDGMDKLSVKDLFERFARKSTFRAILRDDRKGASLRYHLNQGCAAAINKITDEGKTLESEALKKAIIPVTDVRFATGVQDTLFYHWTKGPGLGQSLGLDVLSPADALKKARYEGGFDSVFDFLRTRTFDQHGLYWGALYIAEDPDSSREYGDKLYEFKFDPNAAVLRYDYSVWLSALKEIGKRYPQIESNCVLDLSKRIIAAHGEYQFNNLIMIIAEDTGVSMIDYNQQQKWFQLLSPTAIIGIKNLK